MNRTNSAYIHVLSESKLRLNDFITLQSEVRLDRFAYELGRCRRSADRDSVHDLRVAIRRCESCLATFEAFFPPRPAQRFHRRLRKVLKPAGAVRDRDITLVLARGAGVAVGSALVTESKKQRQRLAKSLRAGIKLWAKQNSSDKWRRRLAVTTPDKSSKNRWDRAATSSENAAAVLPKLTRQFFRAGRKVTAPETPDRKLHRFRLKVKHFRYTLELFRSCYGPTLDEHIGKLKKLQAHLGAMNDCASTIALLAKPAFKDLDGVEGLERYLTEQIRTERAAFFAYWERIFNGEDAERRWSDYLARFAGRASKPNHSSSAVTAVERVSA
jgi:CHAD domain-containing protein